MTRRICFIDDDGRFEVPLFLSVFSGRFDVVAGTDLATCEAEIRKRGDWRPDLFVLDLHYPTGTPDPEAIEALAATPPTVLDDRGKLRATYTNYLAAARRLRAALRAHGQGTEGGLSLARAVRERFAGVPVVFYSRKASPEDVLRCLGEDAVVDVVHKPTGGTDAATERLTQERADAIARRFEDAVTAFASDDWPARKHRMREAAGLALAALERFRGEG